MTRSLRIAAAAAFAVIVTLAIVALSQVPYTAETDGMALIRLSWRALGERVEECRPLTEEERRGLPQHMQRTEVCEGRIAPYELELVIDGAPAVLDTIRGAGARGNLPLFVYRELRVPPGSHRVEVAFRQLTDSESVDEQPDERTAPPTMGLDVPVQLGPRDVALITYDAEQRRLVLRTSR